MVDNDSIYSKNLENSLQNIEFTKRRYDDLELSEIKTYDNFIISGRKMNVQKMNMINSQIIKHAISENKSLLGICYGAEILALTVGGTIKKMESPQRGIQQVMIKNDNSLCSGVINTFHSNRYCISHLNGDLTNLATSKENPYEIIQYGKMNIFGTQFHPEMNLEGQKIIESFVTL